MFCSIYAKFYIYYLYTYITPYITIYNHLYPPPRTYTYTIQVGQIVRYKSKNSGYIHGVVMHTDRHPDMKLYDRYTMERSGTNSGSGGGVMKGLLYGLDQTFYHVSSLCMSVYVCVCGGGVFDVYIVVCLLILL